MRISESIAETMKERKIRAWHYIKLTDDEVDLLQRDGVHLSTPESLRLYLKDTAIVVLPNKDVDLGYVAHEDIIMVGELDIRNAWVVPAKDVPPDQRNKWIVS